MKKIILLLWSIFIFAISFAWNIDTCCIINTIDYQKKLKTTQHILATKYPNLQKKADNTVYEIVKLVNTDPKFNSYNDKLKIYSTIVNKVVNYVYNHNIEKRTPVYDMLSYFVYRIQDMYEYTKNTRKYKLESTLENMDKYPYTY